MKGYVTILMILMLLTMGYGLRTREVEWAEEEEEEEETETESGITLVLPGYNYCGVGNDFLNKISNWKQSAPINPLDLACFYHDIAYTDSRSTAAEIREADSLLVNRVKEIYNNLTGGFFSNLVYKAELQIVMKAVQAKMALEDKRLVNPLSLVSKDPARSQQVYDVLMQNNLPDAWGLPYSY